MSQQQAPQGKLMQPQTSAAANATSAPAHESQLIGSILSQDVMGEFSGANPANAAAAGDNSKAPDGALHRVTSAPPMLSNAGLLVSSPDDYDQVQEMRATKGYFDYYYGQKPIDPRLPQPLVNWGWHGAREQGQDENGMPNGAQGSYIDMNLVNAELSGANGNAMYEQPNGDAADNGEQGFAPDGTEMGAMLPTLNAVQLSQFQQMQPSEEDAYNFANVDVALMQSQLPNGLTHLLTNNNMVPLSPQSLPQSIVELQKQMQNLSIGASAIRNAKPGAVNFLQQQLNQQQQQQFMAGNMGAMPANQMRMPQDARAGRDFAQQPVFPNVVNMPNMGNMPMANMPNMAFQNNQMPMMPPQYRSVNGTNASPMMAVMGYGPRGSKKDRDMQQRMNAQMYARNGGAIPPPNLAFSPNSHDAQLWGDWGQNGDGFPPNGPMQSQAQQPFGRRNNYRRNQQQFGPRPQTGNGMRGRRGNMNWNNHPSNVATGNRNGPSSSSGVSISPYNKSNSNFDFAPNPRSPTNRHMMPHMNAAAPSSSSAGPINRPPKSRRANMDFQPPMNPMSNNGMPAEESPHRRHSILDDFRKGHAANISLRHVVERGLVVELAADQYGSRFIQQRLELATPEEKEAAFQQLLPETLRLCTDVFGNYVIQKFFEYGNESHKNTLINQLLGHILMLSLQMYGCRVVQKAIDVADLEQQTAVVHELHGHVMECVKDQNGNHVIQKCIEKVPPHLINFIVEAFVNQIYHLSTHPYGCRVIQRLLEHCSEEQRNSILTEILDNTRELCKNQYGNYVIQHVLVHGTSWHRGAIIQSLRGSVMVLSKHKFASNVIEKCFAHANREDRSLLIEEVLGKEDDSNSPLIAMVKDQFANYVIQKMIDVVDEDQRAMIVRRIKVHVPNLRKIPYGKHIIARIERLTGKPIEAMIA